MKKKWTILIALVAIAVMAYGVIGSGAWFTDTQTISDNVITTGIMELGVSGGPLVVNNLEPGAGYQPAGYFCAQNTGNYGSIYWDN